MDTLFRRGTRAGADASGDGKYARQGGGADQANPARSASPRQARATAMADDRAQFPEGLDGAEDCGWATDRGHFRSHQVPISDPATHPGHLKLLEDWLRSYRPQELFDS